MARKDFYVYVWLRKNLYSPFYVGKGSGYRDTDRQRKGCKPPKDKNRIRRVATNLTEEDAFALEKTLIRFYGKKSEGGILINLTDGGEGRSGLSHSEETRALLSKQTKERYADKRNHPRYNVRLTEEQKRKQSESHKGKPAWNKGVTGYKTQPATEERRAKVGKKCVCYGVTYPTASHAARALGVTSVTVSANCRRDSNKDFYYL